jgi:hypothetical protein
MQWVAILCRSAQLYQFNFKFKINQYEISDDSRVGSFIRVVSSKTLNQDISTSRRPKLQFICQHKHIYYAENNVFE